jgi:hypothetical protein
MEDTRDFQIITCKDCGASKKRIRDGKRPESKETRFVGEDGLEWNGRKCGVCHRDSSALNKKLKSRLKKL